jgi:co-chaperonin GroES (HSP10)
MKALRHFIVNVPKKTEDTVKLGDKEIFLDSRFDEFNHRICYGRVVSAPHVIETGVREGDLLFFHHHVTQNKTLSLGDDNYLVVYDEENPRGSHAIAHRDSEGVLHMLSEWVFVQPVEEKVEEEVTPSGIIIDLKVKERDDREAVVFMPHQQLMNQGVKVGDVVGFDKDSDYKMKLDDESIVYRMRLEDISYVKTA